MLYDKWLSNYDTVEFLGLWEELSNENFNSAEFIISKMELPKKSFTMSPRQIIEFLQKNIVPRFTEKQKQFIYANEADVINVALFGTTAKEWRESNPDLDGNIRDCADILHLIVLSNLEVLNASMIDNNISQRERL